MVEFLTCPGKRSIIRLCSDVIHECQSCFLHVEASEVKVRYSDLKLCEKDEQVCVTDLRGCGPRPPSSIQREYTHLHTHTQTHSHVSITFGDTTDMNISNRFTLTITRGVNTNCG